MHIYLAKMFEQALALNILLHACDDENNGAGKSILN